LWKRRAQSIRYFNKAIKKYPDYYEAYYRLVAQKRLGQDDQAMASFQETISLSGGKYMLAEYAYALLLCSKGKAADAEQAVRYALESGEHKPIGEVVLGTVELYLRRPDDAEKSAREALSLDPNLPDGYLVLAAVYGVRNDYAAEIRELDMFINLEPTGPRADSVREIRRVAEGLAARMGTKP
jgi:tetratricopeptide (TPR) repeat protein